jgi:hypothetical protein
LHNQKQKAEAEKGFSSAAQPENKKDQPSINQNGCYQTQIKDQFKKIGV